MLNQLLGKEAIKLHCIVRETVPLFRKKSLSDVLLSVSSHISHNVCVCVCVGKKANSSGLTLPRENKYHNRECVTAAIKSRFHLHCCSIGGGGGGGGRYQYRSAWPSDITENCGGYAFLEAKQSELAVKGGTFEESFSSKNSLP